MGFFKSVTRIFKPVLRIAAPIAGSIFSGPWGAAVGASLGGLVTGANRNQILRSTAYSGLASWGANSLFNGLQNGAASLAGKGIPGMATIAEKMGTLNNFAGIPIMMGNANLGSVAGAMLGSEAGRGNLTGAMMSIPTMAAGALGGPMAVFGTSAVTGALMGERPDKTLKRSVMSAGVSALGGALSSASMRNSLLSNLTFEVGGTPINLGKIMSMPSAAMSSLGAGMGHLAVGAPPIMQISKGSAPTFDMSGAMEGINEKVKSTIDESFAKIINVPKLFGTTPLKQQQNKREISFDNIRKFYSYPGNIKKSIKANQKFFKNPIIAF